MADVSSSLLLIILVILVVLSAFFSGSEIGMMSLNRYRLRHAVRKKHRAAIRVDKLLKRPDRLLAVILIGNTFANIVASAAATILAARLWGDYGIAIATVILTLIILIFSEMAPKTLAAFHPEKVAYAVSLPLKVLQWCFSPFIWLTGFIANGFLRLLGVNVSQAKSEHLSPDELRNVVNEAGGLIANEHKKMLVNILDLEKVTVEDIMIPRNEILGIDIDDEWEDILHQLETSQHTRLPVFKEDINQVKGVLHVRHVSNRLAGSDFTLDTLLQSLEECYFVPEATNLYTQLLNCRKEKQRTCLVVDEYGDIQGLVTLEDILEEIVGEFTTDMAASSADVIPQDDGSVMVDGGISLRELNRSMRWHFPTSGPKTLSGLIIEYLEAIPPANTCLQIDNYQMEITQVKSNMVKSVRIRAVNLTSA